MFLQPGLTIHIGEQFSDCILQKGWHTAAEVKQMSHDDQRNTVMAVNSQTTAITAIAKQIIPVRVITTQAITT